MRLPNLLTAWGDPVVGALWAGMAANDPHLATPVAGVLLVYAGGMILNDVADFSIDTRERPARPLPSGRIPRTRAAGVGVGCTLAGLGALSLANERTLAIGAALAVLALLYNFALKRMWLGPLAMGGCRALSVLVGATAGSALTEGAAWTALIMGGYVALLSTAARNEMSGGRWTPAHTGRALGLILLLQTALCTAAVVAGPWRWAWAAALVLMLPLHAALRRRWAAG